MSEPAKTVGPVKARCVHRSEGIVGKLGLKVEGTMRHHDVFECAVHGHCSRGPVLTGLATCDGCADYLGK